MPVIVHDPSQNRIGRAERRPATTSSKHVPTPVQDRSRYVLPTPETVRHPRKARTKASPSTSAQVDVNLPTPQTVPRKRAASPELDDTFSPEGHTTFSHTSAGEEKHGGGMARRRPGLTFAQQMGLAGASASKSGRGVGMGGHRASNHAVDRIAPKMATGQDDPFVGPSHDDNPFLVSPFETQKVSPLFAPLSSGGQRGARAMTPPRLMQPPADSTSPTNSATRHAAQRARQRQAEAAQRRAREAKRKEMLDEDNNPFLLKPGESIQPKRTSDDAHQPFVTYVFRGTRRIFANPFIPSDARLPNTELRPEDEDFDDHPCPKPRLLWPTAGKVGQRPTDDDEVTPSPPSSPLLRTPQTRPRAEVDDAEELEAGSGIKRRDESELQPGRRAKVSRRL